MYGINSEPPKNCLDCPLCQGEYGKGNEKSYCAIKSEVKLKYNGSRPKECPIIVDPLPQWQIEFLSTLINKSRSASEIIKAYTKGFDMGVETVKNERSQGEWIDVNGDGSLWKCNNCGEKSCCKGNYCPDCGAKMKGGAK